MPAAAFAVNAHHAWIGAAADTLASGGPADPVAGWLLCEAAQGGFIAGWPGIRAQLNRVIGCWQQRIAAGGAVTSLDPGGQWLIRLFTVRYAAADGARRVIELARQITEHAREQAGPVGPVPGRAG